MIKKWLFTLLLLGLGVLWQPAGFASRSVTECWGPSACRSGVEAMAQPHGFILADNHRTDKQTSNTDTSNSDQAGEKTATDNKNKTKKEDHKTKPLKSFEPTEKVKADQAVDFPYDI